jgi:hypothetical protein
VAEAPVLRFPAFISKKPGLPPPAIVDSIRRRTLLCYNYHMLNASQTLDRYYLEMRGKCLALAADHDRVARADGGPAMLVSDPRLKKLNAALAVLTDGKADKAERVQLVFSDRTVGPNPPAQ